MVDLNPQSLEICGDTLGLSQCSRNRRPEAGRFTIILQKEGLSYIRKNYFVPNEGRKKNQIYHYLLGVHLSGLFYFQPKKLTDLAKSVCP